MKKKIFLQKHIFKNKNTKQKSGKTETIKQKTKKDVCGKIRKKNKKIKTKLQ